MWTESASEAYDEVEFEEPEGAAAVEEAERRLGEALPPQLAELLAETDGVVGPYGLDVVWPLERIVEDNLRFRTESSLAELYMPFDPLLFFGDNGDGDQFAFVRQPERSDVFVWEHENDSRRWVAGGLRDYLQRSLTADGEDWYR
ncbi:SMI1/KNR4 family protein [Streptomyces iconiensis]|uniref:SMI1/KNR4 family protein n=1 Tax=Streptomyces iconiensis TaxID=1384038 RepID=A0ABT7A5I9_9ACTN|nr:SMI1/KNR4 family protein [Streptomyces iconiensis]MDJ1136106.1 SMI1/KNR4 family protein [Streptomyces iconiensis]